ncbi:MAG: diguanylate cyclase [Thiohalomonadaceae bacterium]
MRNVLVVDGSAVSRELLTRVISEELKGARVTACGSGHDALERLASEHFDLITTALVLPDMDGLYLCRHIRSSQEHYLTPIIVTSGDADGRLLREGFAAGVTDYFEKSHGYQAFGPFLRRFIERHASLSGRVLYVEDSHTVAAHTRKILERHGLHVEHVLSAEEALQLVRTEFRGTFDLVITDMALKGELSGGDLLHVLRTQLRYSQEELPVLVLTGDEGVQTQLEVFRAGANDFVSKPLVEEVLMARVRLLLTVKHQFDTLRQQAQAMQRMAVTDSLTGVYNRHYLVNEGTRFAADKRHQPLWVMIIDLDHFKRINDNHGHLTGDIVLTAVGQLLSERFQDGLPVRFGGEEFAVLVPHCTRQQAGARAEELRAAVAALKPGGVSISVSIGVACSEQHPEGDLNALIALADKALYAAKAAGRNCIYFADARSGVLPLAAAD